MNFRLATIEGVVGVSIFNRAFMKSQLLIGTNVIVIGKYDKVKNVITASDIRLGSLSKESKIEPVYHLTSGLTNKNLVTFINLGLMMYGKEVIDYLPTYLMDKYNFLNKKTSLNIITDSLNTSIASLIITLSVLLFLQLIFITFSGIFGIILGNTFNRKKGIYTVLIGFLTYICANVIILLITLLLSVFNDNIYSILFGGTAFNVETLLTLSWVISAVYLVINTILYFVTNKIFNKGVNIE